MIDKYIILNVKFYLLLLCLQQRQDANFVGTLFHKSVMNLGNLLES